MSNTIAKMAEDVQTDLRSDNIYTNINKDDVHEETNNNCDNTETLNDNVSVILIDSDEEEDNRTRFENRPIRLVPDGRVGRPRDVMNRFVNQQGTNRVIVRRENERANHYITDDDDGITIVRAVDRVDRADGPIDPDTEFIDLESEGMDRDNMSNGISNNRTIVLNHREGNSNDDDGLVIVEERTRQPRVTLNLPGGETLQIDASSNDLPTHRSFEWLDNLPDSRRQLLRRSARGARRSARNLFYTEDDNQTIEEQQLASGLPRNIMRLRQQQEIRLRQAVQRRRNEQTERGNGPIGNPALDSIRERIQTYPPDVRSAFDHAQSLYEFRSILQSIDPLTLEECGDELTRLFTDYRSHLMQNWATNRVQSIRNEAQRTRAQQRHPPIRSSRVHWTSPHPAGRRRLGPNLRGGRTWNESGGGHDSNDDSGDISEDLGFLLRLVPEYHNLYGYDSDPDDSGPSNTNDAEREDERTQNIINMIQEREERERDARVKTFMSKSKEQQEAFHEKAKNLPDDYSANFDTTPKMKLNIVKNGQEERVIVDDDDETWENEIEVPSCVLCGVELGVGIPGDFQSIDKYDHGMSFEYLVEKYKYSCPYQSLLRPTQLDRDLSRRTYIANCGHTYCGRCYVRIDNARSKVRSSKKKLAELKGSSHPDIYGPKVCPADGCKTIIRSKNRLKEVYF